MTLQLIELAERADATLDAQADSFEKLRRLDRNAPQVLDEIAKEQEGLAARIESAKDALDRARRPVPEGRPGSPDGRAGAGAQAHGLRRDRRREGARRAGQAQGRRRRRRAGGAAGRRSGRPAAREHRHRGRPTSRRAPSCARSMRRSSTSSCSELARRSRPREDYITTHRGAVGAGARTRISEAHRHLEAAVSLAAGDPANALEEALEADKLAVAAIQSARNDVAEYERTTTAAGVPRPARLSGGRQRRPGRHPERSVLRGRLRRRLGWRLVVGRLVGLRRLVELAARRVRRLRAVERLVPAQQRRLARSSGRRGGSGRF